MKNKSIDPENMISTADPFELLLNEKYDVEHRLEQEEELERHKPLYSKASGNVNFDGFITMVKDITTKVLKKYNIKFLPDEGSRMYIGPAEKTEPPYIFYTLESRVPKQNEPAPKVREEIIEKNRYGKNVRMGTLYGQVFDCIVQFNIVCSDYTSANAVMNSFEDLMFKYIAYFKKNGVSNLYFYQQFTDDRLDSFREKMSIRSLQYKVQIEKLIPVYDSTIADISSFDNE